MVSDKRTVEFWTVVIQVSKDGEFVTVGSILVPSKRCPSEVDAIRAAGVADFAEFEWVRSEREEGVWHPLSDIDGTGNELIRAAVKGLAPKK